MTAPAAGTPPSVSGEPGRATLNQAFDRAGIDHHSDLAELHDETLSGGRTGAAKPPTGLDRVSIASHSNARSEGAI